MAVADRRRGKRSSGRDLVDGITSAWRREMPEVDRVDVELTRRAARLGVILEDRLADCLAPWGLTKAEFNVLNVLRAAGAPYELRPTDLGARLTLTSGGISNVLNRLARAGFIERERDAFDARSSWVRLTPQGVQTAEDTMRAWVADQEKFYRTVTKTQVQAASNALRQILLALGDDDPGEPRKRLLPTENSVESGATAG